MRPERFADDVANGHARVQRGQRVLKDDLQLATHLPQLSLIELVQAPAHETHLAARRRHELQDRPCQRGLAAARLADDPECLSGRERQVDPVDRLELTLASP